MTAHAIVALMLMVLGVACFATYGIIGAHVAPDGTLVEPFALLPIGYLLVAAGIVWGGFAAAICLRRASAAAGRAPSPKD